jgi:methylated-DNA-[protein]-cysteine S-methyltransferase
MEKITFAVLPTLFGWMGVIASQRGIRRLNLPTASRKTALQNLGPEIIDGVWDPSSFEKLRLKIERYFLGEKVCFDEALDLRKDAKFFQHAWKACASIPRGETKSYAWLAMKSGSPSAVRAAGQAMARNPVCIIIPCHRVIGSNGLLGGFGGGLALKQRMIELELKQ